ncbi:MAG: hypothetical protein MOGMAGMI_02134 [Candidatus Omnitrophica bacterium]|nr:hypothetical protein [Candidatus Omnitrophota bacterium]
MQVHSFHIPVMGTGFTIDTPLKVGRYGISSVMSVDDNLMEKMREHYSAVYGQTYVPIPKDAPDSRARRITEYIDLVGGIVSRQVKEVRCSAFEPGSEITKYHELLPEDSPIKEEYLRMLSTHDPEEKVQLQGSLRRKVTAGSIGVNILTKLDRPNYREGQPLEREQSDAMSALRGFAKSRYGDTIVLSAGVNPHLFSYFEEFGDFYADADGAAKKKIILKVSDFRSAFTQGRIFAKKGIWVWEYRIESGLNCGGHAFATVGHLMGMVLEEFKQKRAEFTAQLSEIYRKAVQDRGVPVLASALRCRVTAQGGIGTGNEDRFLRRYYELDGTGWGTPFLLVPEATSVDDVTLERLVQATGEDVRLTKLSPMGVPIYSLRTSVSEEVRLRRIREGRPGSPCMNGYMAFNTEFTAVPICTASYAYQKRKIDELKKSGLSEEEYSREYDKIVDKACVCHDLGDSALLKSGLRYANVELAPAICPGPNIAYYSRIFSLKEMVDHIYSRANVLDPSVRRPHVLVNELGLYINHLIEFVAEKCHQATQKELSHFDEFKQNLLDGIQYYRGLADAIREESVAAREVFVADLRALQSKLETVVLPVV